MEREWRQWVRLLLAAVALYLLLYGLLWLSHTLMAVRFVGLVRTPLDLLVSLPALALYLTVALMALAFHLRQRMGAGHGTGSLEPSQPLGRSPLVRCLRRVPPVSAQTSREAALRQALAYGVTLLPCTNGQAVVGAVGLSQLAASDGQALPVGPAPLVRMDQPLSEVLHHLRESPTLVVVDRDGRTYLGLLDARDALAALLGPP